MTGGHPDPWGPAHGRDPAGVPSGDVLEGGLQPPWWRSRWAALSRRMRLLAVALVIVLAAGAAGLWLRDRAADRALAERVDLAVSLGVWSSSTAPLGGEVSYFVVVRNEGARPVVVTSVEGSAGGGLRLRARDDAEWPVAADGEAAVPLSVRLTCAGYADGDGLRAAIGVRREDGGTVTRPVRPEPAELLLGVARSLCTIRPDLSDEELSGPVLDHVPALAPAADGAARPGWRTPAERCHITNRHHRQDQLWHAPQGA